MYEIADYVGLVDFSIMPHLDSPNFHNRKETLLEAVGSFEGRVYGLRNDSAVAVDANHIRTIGSDPIIIEKGKMRAIGSFVEVF